MLTSVKMVQIQPKIDNQNAKFHTKNDGFHADRLEADSFLTVNPTNQVNFALKTMNFVFKMMNLYFIRMISVFKMMNQAAINLYSTQFPQSLE